MKKYFAYILILPLAIALFAIPAFCQETKTEETAAKEAAVSAPAAAPVVPAPAAETPKMNELSIYGEVQSVNPAANSIKVQYYDYDNDEEKSIDISVDKDTKLENARDISEIKKGDWADITYIASAGKNLAKTMSVEKEEPIESTPAAPEQ